MIDSEIAKYMIKIFLIKYNFYLNYIIASYKKLL